MQNLENVYTVLNYVGEQKDVINDDEDQDDVLCVWTQVGDEEADMFICYRDQNEKMIEPAIPIKVNKVNGAVIFGPIERNQVNWSKNGRGVWIRKTIKTILVFLKKR